MQKYFNTVANRTGISQEAATVTVTTLAGGVAALYSDNGVTPLASNVLTTDGNGYFEFYAADGRYSLTITGSNINTMVISDVLLEDAADGSTPLTAETNARIAADAVLASADASAAAALLAQGGAALIGNTPAGAIAAVTVQAALNELDTEKASLADLAASGGSALVGYLPAGTGAVATTVQTKLRESVSVKDFGAAGDGVTDDTAAFLSAIGGYSDRRRIFVPAGVYLITATLALGLYKELVGESTDTSRLLFNSANNFGITGDAFSSVENILITNITSPLGTKTAIASYTPTTSNGWRNGKLKNVRIQDFHVGIGSTQGLTQGLMFQNVYERVRIYSANTGVQMGAGSNANSFINCEFWDCARAVDLNNVTSQTFIGCGFEGSTTYDFYVDASYNVKFETCYFEPARGGIFSASTGSFDNCHATAFATPTTRFLGHLGGSCISINDFTDYNFGGGSALTQEYYKSLDLSGQAVGVNCRVRTGTEKTIPPALDGVVVVCVQLGDWLITRYGNGLMTMDCNTDISTNTLIMTGTTTSYSATLTLPDSFKDGNFSATANICFNGAATFLLIDNPMIAVRPNTANSIGLAANRATSVGADGYFYSIRCVGLWK